MPHKNTFMQKYGKWKSSKMPLPTLIEFESCLDGGAPVKDFIKNQKWVSLLKVRKNLKMRHCVHKLPA